MSAISSFSVLVLVVILAVVVLATPGASAQPAESLGWKPHFIRQGDGEGGWLLKPAQCQILRYRERGLTLGFGLAQMDNGEIVLLGICAPKTSLWYGGDHGRQTLIAFSSDRGNTWSELEPIPGITGRPMMLAYLGGGNLTFESDRRYFSSDYGRTWLESVPVQPAPNGGPFYTEGNPLVDRDEQGMATRIAEIGYNSEATFVRWSDDGGRTWTDESSHEQYWAGQGESRLQQPDNKGWGSEGALVRASNGWLVAALRTGLPYRISWGGGAESDQHRSTSICISRDDGQTWSDPQRIVDGRMHANLQKIPNGDLVMTVVVRHNIADGKLVSYRRGYEAIVSHDNGLTWDVDRKYILDEWEFYDSLQPAIGQCGHLGSTVLDDGSILTVQNNYLTMGITLVRWRAER